MEAHCLETDEMSQMVTLTLPTIIAYFSCRRKTFILHSA